MISCEKITDEAKLKHGWVSYMKTEVFDNGVGIEKEKQEKLFYTFKAQQLDMTHGVGIGLSTVRAVAEASGGDVNLKSKVGTGTRIMFTTPISSKDRNKVYQKTLKQQLGNKSSLMIDCEDLRMTLEAKKSSFAPLAMY